MPPRQEEAEEAVPSVPPRPSAESGTMQQSEDEDEPTPYKPPMGANTAEDETPYLDSLPSTPRAGSVERGTATPFGAGQPHDAMQDEAQDAAAVPGGIERAADEAPAAGAHPPGSGDTN